jgi:hypothetical protein
MMRVSTVLLAIYLGVCYLLNAEAREITSFNTGEPIIHESLDLSNFVISDKLPNSYELSHRVWDGKSSVKANDDIPSALAEREREYSWHWMRKTLNTSLLSSKRKNNIELVRRINGKDDGAFLSYSLPIKSWEDSIYDISIIDDRCIWIRIHCMDFENEQILDIVYKVIYYYYSGDYSKTEVCITDEQKINDKRSYGRIEVYKEFGTDWFDRPIEWYKNGDTVIFLFQKTVIMQDSKTPVDSSDFIGGMPYSDQRALLRFEESNRKIMSDEYRKKLYPDD